MRLTPNIKFCRLIEHLAARITCNLTLWISRVLAFAGLLANETDAVALLDTLDFTRHGYHWSLCP